MKRNVFFNTVCPGCNSRLRIEFVTEPLRTGAMWTVDCPVCGTSKMVLDEPVRIAFAKDGDWVDSAPHTRYARGQS
jgi:hypothetical protein